MKLYFSAGSCSTAPHLVIQELGLQCQTEAVDLKTKVTASGSDFTKINPKGSVPALLLDNGELLTETAIIIQYLCDQKPQTNMFPTVGTFERYRAQEWLNYIATEMHKGIAIFWNPKVTEDSRTALKEKLSRQFSFLSNHLGSQGFVLGSQYSAADAYLFTVLSWAPHVKVDLTPWPNLLGYLERVKSRPTTLATLKAEGVIK